MLVRRTLDREKTVRKGRQEWPEYCVIRSHVLLDPWENYDCLVPLGEVFSRDFTNEDPASWLPVASNTPHFKDGAEMTRIAEDPEAGFIYYRRAIDRERQEKWNHDRSFRVSASEW